MRQVMCQAGRRNEQARGNGTMWVYYPSRATGWTLIPYIVGLIPPQCRAGQVILSPIPLAEGTVRVYTTYYICGG